MRYDLGEEEIAHIMLAGVRMGGSPYTPTPFRWGYGWPYGRFYQALNQQEQQQVLGNANRFSRLLLLVSNQRQ